MNERLHIFNNFLVIWDKVALNESDIVHRLTQNTKNTVLQDTEYFENRVPKLPSVAEFNSNILVIQENICIAQYNAVFFYLH